MFYIAVSIPFVGILLVIFLGLSNTRNLIVHRLLIRRKQQKQQHYTLPTANTVSSSSYLAIPMTSFTDLTSVTLYDDDEDLIKYDLSSDFCETSSIELRLDQDPDSDNDASDI